MEPKGDKRVQTGAKGTPKGPQREPKGPQREPKGAQREANGSQREPKGSQMVAKMHPKVDQSSISEKGHQKVTKMLPKLMIFGAIFHEKSADPRRFKAFMRGGGLPPPYPTPPWAPRRRSLVPTHLFALYK